MTYRQTNTTKNINSFGGGNQERLGRELTQWTQNICITLHNVGPTSSPLVQHCTNVIQMFTGESFFTSGHCLVSYLSYSTLPANTTHLYNICTMWDQRRRCWADVVQMLYKCFVFSWFLLLCNAIWNFAVGLLWYASLGKNDSQEVFF